MSFEQEKERVILLRQGYGGRRVLRMGKNKKQRESKSLSRSFEEENLLL